MVQGTWADGLSQVERFIKSGSSVPQERSAGNGGMSSVAQFAVCRLAGLSPDDEDRKLRRRTLLGRGLGIGKLDDYFCRWRGYKKKDWSRRRDKENGEKD